MEFATEDRAVVLYGYDRVTKEYTHMFEYYWVAGTGLAAESTLVQPPVQNREGFTKVFNGEFWDYVEDHRGKLIFAKTNQHIVKIVRELGPIDNLYTDLQPSTKFDTWNGTGWEDSRTIEQVVSDIAKELPALTRRQFKLALLDAGLLEQVDIAIASIPDAAVRARVQIEYTESTTFDRLNPSVISMCSMLGLTEEQINAIWTQALTY